jgi:hypothetical protein
MFVAPLLHVLPAQVLMLLMLRRMWACNVHSCMAGCAPARTRAACMGHHGSCKWMPKVPSTAGATGGVCTCVTSCTPILHPKQHRVLEPPASYLPVYIPSVPQVTAVGCQGVWQPAALQVLAGSPACAAPSCAYHHLPPTTCGRISNHNTTRPVWHACMKQLSKLCRHQVAVKSPFVCVAVCCRAGACLCAAAHRVQAGAARGQLHPC